MCNFCMSFKGQGAKYVNDHGEEVIVKNFRRLAKDKAEDNSRGFVMAILRDSGHNKIERGKLVPLPEGETGDPFVFIKAWEWDNNLKEKGQHLAFRINYCPVCGERF